MLTILNNGVPEILHTNVPSSVEPKKSKSKRGHAKALPLVDLSMHVRLRVGHLMSIYGLSHSSVYVHLSKNYIPPPDGKIANRPYWKSETIRKDLEK